MPGFVASDLRKPWYRVLYIQVIAAIILGIVVGHFWPATAVEMKPLGDGFIKLIKMVIALVIFCTVVSGIYRRSTGCRIQRKSGDARCQGCRSIRRKSQRADCCGVCAEHHPEHGH